MDIFEFAMQMEKDGEAYYRDLAGKTKIVGLQKILTYLAEDEAVHYKVFQELKESSPASSPGSTVLKDAKNVFAVMKEEKPDYDLEGTEVNFYKKAIEIEKKSEDFYREKAGEIDSAEAKELLLKIADEERHHAFLLENMVSFLSRPAGWVENAEFNHLDEY